MAKNKTEEYGDEIDWDTIDWKALDRVNDEVAARQAADPGDTAERAELMSEILGGLAGEDALKALKKQAAGQ